MADSLKKVQGNVTEDVYNDFAEFKAEHEDCTFSQLIELLLERYKNPLKINKGNEDKIKALEQAHVKKDKIINDCKVDIDTLCDENSKLKALLAKGERDLSDALAESGKKVKLDEGQHILAIDQLNWLVLQNVAEREGKRRDQSWSEEDVVNYFIYSRFVKGELNGDLDSLPDKLVKVLEQQIKEDCNKFFR